MDIAIKFCIEMLTSGGFWTPLSESTEATGFRMQPHPVFPARDLADQRRSELIAVGWEPSRIRVVGVDEADLAKMEGLL